mmetsp:Transcript_1761/g.4467  ORF Transcript_1761/g.4467 Transcript_1761/m.4467 type:complete len:216 (-) Transcript_1761:212-859(-)
MTSRASSSRKATRRWRFRWPMTRTKSLSLPCSSRSSRWRWRLCKRRSSPTRPRTTLTPRAVGSSSATLRSRVATCGSLKSAPRTRPTLAVFSSCTPPLVTRLEFGASSSRRKPQGVRTLRSFAACFLETSPRASTSCTSRTETLKPRSLQGPMLRLQRMPAWPSGRRTLARSTLARPRLSRPLGQTPSFSQSPRTPFGPSSSLSASPVRHLQRPT